MVTTDRGQTLLHSVGRNVLTLRRRQGMTRSDLASGSHLSTRFLADLEAGRANISLVKLDQVAVALGTSVTALLEEPREKPIALLGLRGAGKSTIGTALADRLGLEFIEMDQLVEDRAGLPLAEIFAVHGEGYYRRIEAETVLQFLTDAGPCVVATGGGIVTNREAFEPLRRACTCVWLKATPEEHMGRVVAQGDLRPIDTRPDAMSELRQILAARAPLYAEAHIAQQTTNLELDKVVDRLVASL